ncbi:hypothetical protein LWC33_28255 [Pseudonocardia sp. RS11V-5]|uniref:hypothetical protein n=1 Tax=Pseudonocardia terrae TaxID=2905831 RepID=UPI001E4692B2|nr:hypothetical protein [Pseudonocardia terrae]MCE3555332.1 hypothetical protein [Pseudonocardia terrae]
MGGVVVVGFGVVGCTVGCAVGAGGAGLTGGVGCLGPKSPRPLEPPHQPPEVASSSSVGVQ